MIDYYLKNLNFTNFTFFVLKIGLQLFYSYLTFFVLETKINERYLMPEKENKDINVKEGKIFIGEGKIVCFACGEVVDANTKICPYCNTELQ